MLTLEQCGKPGKFLASDNVMLIGSAPHCNCRVLGLPPLAAVVARYGGSWLLHNLQATQLQLNRVDVMTRHEVGDGDQLQVGSIAFQVSEASGPAAALPRMSQQCRISVSAPGMAPNAHDLTFDTLIGSSHLCDIVLPRNANSPDRHSLLVPARGHWYLYDLLGRVGRHNGKDWRTRVELDGGDRIETKGVVIEVLSVSASTSSKFQPTASSTTDSAASSPGFFRRNFFPPRPPAAPPEPARKSASGAMPSVAPSAAPPPGPSSAAPAATPLPPLPSFPLEPPSRSSVETAPRGDTSAIVHSRPFADMASPPEHFDPDAFDLAQQVYGFLKSQHNLYRPPVRGLPHIVRVIRDAGRQSRAEAEFLAGRRVLGLQQMKALLEESPWSRSALIGLARMCDAGGFDHLCLGVMLLLHRMAPEDPFANRAIARIYRQLGRGDSRFLRKAQNHWRAVLAVRPREPLPIEKTIRKIDAEIYVLDRF